MTLVETYRAVAPSVVAFISRSARSEEGRVPIAPTILGTGFLVHEDGIAATNRHVAEALDGLPPDPSTGGAGYGAMLFDYGPGLETEDDAKSSLRMMVIESVGHSSLEAVSLSPAWYGEPSPDIAFVQLRIKGLSSLRFANDEFYVQPGTPIATAGFPLGTESLTFDGKWHQFTPFLRSGIVSSVFPCVVAWPHGFTIDIMQQGGSSGSPIFYADNPTVVGMMASSLLDTVAVAGPQLSLSIGLNTNISVAVPGHIIAQALQRFREVHQIDRSQFPTLSEWKREQGSPSDGLGWSPFTPR